MSKQRARMSPANRAKQFMPFSALRGLEEALERKEKVFIQRRELSEEDERVLNEKILQLKRGEDCAVTHYRGGEYIVTRGLVTCVDTVFRRLKIDYTEISFDDISDIEIQELRKH